MLLQRYQRDQMAAQGFKGTPSHSELPKGLTLDLPKSSGQALALRTGKGICLNPLLDRSGNSHETGMQSSPLTYSSENSQLAPKGRLDPKTLNPYSVFRHLSTLPSSVATSQRNIFSQKGGIFVLKKKDTLASRVKKPVSGG